LHKCAHLIAGLGDTHGKRIEIGIEDDGDSRRQQDISRGFGNSSADSLTNEATTIKMATPIGTLRWQVKGIYDFKLC